MPLLTGWAPGLRGRGGWEVAITIKLCHCDCSWSSPVPVCRQGTSRPRLGGGPSTRGGSLWNLRQHPQGAASAGACHSQMPLGAEPQACSSCLINVGGMDWTEDRSSPFAFLESCSLCKFLAVPTHTHFPARNVVSVLPKTRGPECVPSPHRVGFPR